MKPEIRLLPVCILLIGLGCTKTPQGVLPMDKMKVVFYHHIMAEEMLNNFVARNEKLNYDSARKVLFSGVMKMDKTDSITFARSMDYYKADLERFKELLDSVNALATREKELRQKIEAEKLRKKALADSLAKVDSLAKLKKLHPNAKDSLAAIQDSGKAKRDSGLLKKDSGKRKS